MYTHVCIHLCIYQCIHVRACTYMYVKAWFYTMLVHLCVHGSCMCAYKCTQMQCIVCRDVYTCVYTYTHNIHSPSNQTFSLKVLLLHQRHSMVNLFGTLNTCSPDCQAFHLILGIFLELIFFFFLALKTLKQQRTKREN